MNARGTQQRVRHAAAWDAIVGAGANLGSRHATLTLAARLLAARGVTLVARARRYASAAWVLPGAPEGPPFVNTAWRVRSTLQPHALLRRLLVVERELGRVRGERWAARTLDLDLLTGFADGRELALDTPSLTLPHPGLRTRPFALAPALDVAPELRASRHRLRAPPPIAATLDSEDQRARALQVAHVRGDRVECVVQAADTPPPGLLVAGLTVHGDVVRYAGRWSMKRA